MRLTKLTPDGQGGYGLPRAGVLQDAVIRKETDGTLIRLSDLTEAERRAMGSGRHGRRCRCEPARSYADRPGPGRRPA